MRRVSCTGLWILLLLVPPAASASIIRCDACSPGAYEIVAKRAQEGRHLVYDLPNNHVVGYEVERDDESGEHRAATVAVPADIAALVDALSDFHHETGGAMFAVVEVAASVLQIPRIDGASALEVMEDRNLRAQVADRLATTALPASAIGQAFNAVQESAAALVFMVPGFTDSASIEARISLADGTSVAYRVVPGVGTAEYLRGNARDAAGRIIPEPW